MEICKQGQQHQKWPTAARGVLMHTVHSKKMMRHNEPGVLMSCPPEAPGEWWFSEQVCRLAAAAVGTSLEFTARMQEHLAPPCHLCY